MSIPNFINSLVGTINNQSVKTVISVRGYPFNNTNGWISEKIAKIFYPLLYNRCDLLFSNSIYINKDLKENFGIKIPMEVVYNPIEINNTKSVGRKYLSPVNTLRIINIGSLNDRKNQKIILMALSQLNQNYLFENFGIGDKVQEYTSLIYKLNLEKQAKFHGNTKEMKSKLLNNDCFVLSSKTQKVFQTFYLRPWYLGSLVLALIVSPDH